MKKLVRLDSIKAGGRSREQVHDVLAARCIITPHANLPPQQAEALAMQVSVINQESKEGKGRLNTQKNTIFCKNSRRI